MEFYCYLLGSPSQMYLVSCGHLCISSEDFISHRLRFQPENLQPKLFTTSRRRYRGGGRRSRRHRQRHQGGRRRRRHGDGRGTTTTVTDRHQGGRRRRGHLHDDTLEEHGDMGDTTYFSSFPFCIPCTPQDCYHTHFQHVAKTIVIVLFCSE